MLPLESLGEPCLICASPAQGACRAESLTGFPVGLIGEVVGRPQGLQDLILFFAYSQAQGQLGLV